MTSQTRTPEAAAADSIESLAFRWGCCYDSYLAIEPGREYFWSASGRGALAYVRRGKYLHASGGLLADDEDKEPLLAELLAYAASRRLVVNFYNVTPDDLPLFRSYGFQITKWGEEAVVHLGHCTWEGKAYEWVRRQSNYCQRQGLVFTECAASETTAEAWAELMGQLCEVYPAPLATKPQTAEVRFLEGNFDPTCLGRKRIFVARSEEGAGRIEGFLVCNPAQEGRLWVFETYRHRPDAPRGTVTFLMHQAIQVLEREGVAAISLCMVPGLRCGERMPHDSPLVRRSLAIATRYFNFIFDIAGMYHFKTRFRPQFEDRYLCAHPRVTLGGAWSFIQILGVLNLSPAKLLRVAADRWRKSSARATMPGVPTPAGLPSAEPGDTKREATH